MNLSVRINLSLFGSIAFGSTVGSSIGFGDGGPCGESLRKGSFRVDTSRVFIRSGAHHQDDRILSEFAFECPMGQENDRGPRDGMGQCALEVVAVAIVGKLRRCGREVVAIAIVSVLWLVRVSI